MKIEKGIVLTLVILLLVSVSSVGFATISTAIDQRSENLAFAGGSGTEQDPYQITNVTQLQNMSADLNAHYVLVNDIDASETDGWNGGDGFEPIGHNVTYFRGSFDGQGYNITGLYINRSNTDFVGLFGANDGNISDVVLQNANITGGNYTGTLVGRNRRGISHSYATGQVHGDDGVGGLVGWNYYLSSSVNYSGATVDVVGTENVSGLVGWNDRGEINDSESNGYVQGYIKTGGLVGWNRGWVNDSYAAGRVEGDNQTGGLTGRNSHMIQRSNATGDVLGDRRTGGLVGVNNHTIMNSFAEGTVDGIDHVGGLVGYNSEATISNSYARGDANGTNYIGGLAGWNSNMIENSYSTGQVSGDADVGGLVGLDDSGIVENSFWDNQTSGQETSANGTGKNTTEMKDVATFTNTTTEGLTEAWDFFGNLNDDDGDEDIWDIDEEEQMNDGYPFLVWEVTSGEVETVMINPDTNQTISAGETIDFSAEAYDKYDNLVTDTDTNFTWMNASENGLFNETTVGHYNVSAEYENISSHQVTVMVDAGEVDMVMIDPATNQTVSAGESIDFSAEAYDAYNNLITNVDTDFTWMHTDNDGIFNETAAGQYNVTATYGNVSSEPVTVMVEAVQEVDRVEIEPSANQTIQENETIDFDASAYDIYDNIITDVDTDFTWMNASENGIFNETTAGQYNVSAVYENVSSSKVTVTVTVEKPVVNTVEIDPSMNQTIIAGETLDFNAEAYDQNGNVITSDDMEFTWTGASESGMFNETEAGDYEVMATYENVSSDLVTVTVEPGEVDMVEIDPSTDQTIITGETIDFDASAYDQFNNMITSDDMEFTWQNADETGVFEETEPGEYNVTATYEGVSSDPVTVTVESGMPEFEFSNFRTDPEEPIAGEETTFMIDVTNIGDEAGEYTVEFEMNGEVIGSDTVEVQPDETETASITYTIEEEGDHEIMARVGDMTSDTFTVTAGSSVTQAEFEFSNLRINPEEPATGEEFEIMIDVSNVGGETDEYTVEFFLNGDSIGTDTVEVEPDGTETASINFTVEEEGDHTIEAEGESLNFTVSEEDEEGMSYWWLLIILVIIVIVIIIALASRGREKKEEPEQVEEFEEEWDEESEEPLEEETEEPVNEEEIFDDTDDEFYEEE